MVAALDAPRRYAVGMYETQEQAPGGCREVLLLTRIAFQILLPAILALMGVMLLVLFLFYALATHPALALIPIGIAAAALEGLDMVRFNGKYIDIGNIAGGRIEIPAVKVISNQTQWLGTVHYNPWIIEAALQFLVRVQDRMPVGNVVSHKFPLEQINEAFDFAEWHGREGGTAASRVALTM